MSVYALSDLHGRYDLLEKILAFLKPGDKVYFLGDAADRGPDGWKCLTTIMTDPRFEYVMGNHEKMLVDAMKEYYKYDGEYGWSESYRLLANNGGSNTFFEWETCYEPRIWYHQLRSLPYALSYVNKDGITILLSHAGYTPWGDGNGGIKVPCQYDLVWDRDHVLDEPTDEEDWYHAIIVHGHTPIPILADDINYEEEEVEPGALYYAESRKICIDNGSVWTGCACLLDLDTFEEHIFEIKENENE